MSALVVLKVWEQCAVVSWRHYWTTTTILCAIYSELSNNDSRPTCFLTTLFNPFYNNVNSTTAVSYLSRSDFNKLHCVSVLIWWLFMIKSQDYKSWSLLTSIIFSSSFWLRSGLLHFACIWVAPPWLFMPQAKGCDVNMRASNSNAGKVDQTWSIFGSVY